MMHLFRGVINRFIPLFLKKKLPKLVNIVEISSRESRRLNHFYRKKNRPANVLSFRYGDDYGEILICPALIRKEAKKQGNTYKYQMTWMILHAMLHLSGLHHEKSPRTAQKASLVEQAVLKKIFNPRSSKRQEARIKN